MNLLTTTFAAVTIASASVSATPAFLTNSKQTDTAKPVAKVQLAASETKSEPANTPEPKVVTVQPGDYLTKIADENSTTSLRLFYANTDITNPDLIYPNQQLRVPTPEENLTPRDVPANQQITTPTADESAQAAAPRTYASAAPAVADGSVWDNLAACEAGGNWAINTGNGYYGGLQFNLGSWQGVGGSGLPSQASREEQIMRGQMLQARSGWGAWPACSAKLGLL